MPNPTMTRDDFGSDAEWTTFRKPYLVDAALRLVRMARVEVGGDRQQAFELLMDAARRAGNMYAADPGWSASERDLEGECCSAHPFASCT
jgi:hypothetical protein